MPELARNVLSTYGYTLIPISYKELFADGRQKGSLIIKCLTLGTILKMAADAMRPPPSLSGGENSKAFAEKVRCLDKRSGCSGKSWFSVVGEGVIALVD